MDSIEHFSESRNLARVAAGLKGGPFLNNPVVLPPISFGGWPETTMEKLKTAPIKQSAVEDVWNMRRANGPR